MNGLVKVSLSITVKPQERQIISIRRQLNNTYQNLFKLTTKKTHLTKNQYYGNLC